MSAEASVTETTANFNGWCREMPTESRARSRYAAEKSRRGRRSYVGWDAVLWERPPGRDTPLQLLQDGVEALFGVTKQHARIVLEEQRVLDTSVAGGHAPFQDNRGLSFPDL